MAERTANGPEENNIRDLVENCIHNDDITPLIRLVFEAQSIPNNPKDIQADGRQMVDILSQHLRAVSAEQERSVKDICHSNAIAIAQTVSELEKVHGAVEGVKASLVNGNAAVQGVGSGLVDHVLELNQLAEVADNLNAAASALAAARAVLVECVAAGQLITEHQLYSALCTLDKIRQQHLGSLLSILSAAGGGSSGSSRGRLSRKEQAHLAELHGYFSKLVDDLTASVQHLAMLDFNNWLVSVRAQARDIGMRAIRAASSERTLEESLARERKVLLAALTSNRSVQDIAAELVQAPFRQELLKEMTPAAEQSQPTGLTTLLRGGSFTRYSDAASSDLPPLNLERLHPGEPERALSDAIERRRSQAGPNERRRSQASLAATSGRDQLGTAGNANSSSSLSSMFRDPSGLLNLQMQNLHRALHVATSLGRLEAFQQHYIEQRRLQITADLQPPQNFLEAHQAYLAQVTGFFVIESFVARVTDGLVTPAQGLVLWDVALRSLKQQLERAMDTLRSAQQMLLIKDFALLVCVALERAGYQVAPVSEILLGTRGRYHDLLATQVQKDVSEVVEVDVLSDYEVRTAAQHRELEELGLPWQLEPGGAHGGARRVVLDANGVPPLPYVAPFTTSVPGLIKVIRNFTHESLAYLRGLYSAWELLPAVLHSRDRVMGKVLSDVLTAKAHSVGAIEMLRESMRCATNAWVLSRAMDALDDWTQQQIRPTHSVDAQAADKAARQRSKKSATATSRLSSGMAAALRGVQEAAERDLLRSLTGRAEQVLENSRQREDWLPTGPPGKSSSSWVDALLSYLQETFDAGLKLLPYGSVAHLMRLSLRATAAAVVVAFGPDGVKAYNLYAVQRLAADLATMERFAGRWGIPALAEELAEPCQLCQLLLSCKMEEILVPEVRKQKYRSLDLVLVAHALDKYKELPNQAKKEPTWPAKRAVELLAKQLRAQMVSGTAGTRVLEDS